MLKLAAIRFIGFALLPTLMVDPGLAAGGPAVALRRQTRASLLFGEQALASVGFPHTRPSFRRRWQIVPFRSAAAGVAARIVEAKPQRVKEAVDSYDVLYKSTEGRIILWFIYHPWLGIGMGVAIGSAIAFAIWWKIVAVKSRNDEEAIETELKSIRRELNLVDSIVKIRIGASAISAHDRAPFNRASQNLITATERLLNPVREKLDVKWQDRSGRLDRIRQAREKLEIAAHFYTALRDVSLGRIERNDVALTGLEGTTLREAKSVLNEIWPETTRHDFQKVSWLLALYYKALLKNPNEEIQIADEHDALADGRAVLRDNIVRMIDRFGGVERRLAALEARLLALSNRGTLRKYIASRVTIGMLLVIQAGSLFSSASAGPALQPRARTQTLFLAGA